MRSPLTMTLSGRRPDAVRRRMAAVLIGNTADRVLSRTEASVLVLKPRGFESALTVDVHAQIESAHAATSAP